MEEAEAAWSDRVVMPGEAVGAAPGAGCHSCLQVALPAGGDTVVVGPGLRRETGAGATVTRPGLLRRRLPGPVYWVDCHAKRYVAARGENVIGVVMAKAGDTFRVDIGTSEPASLSYLAFEGATKKNRPAVAVGDLVYAKLLVASRDMEPELVCVDSYGKKAGLGVLTGGGFVFSVPLHLVRKLLAPESGLLAALGAATPFEVAVGMNGRVWVRARSVRETVCLAQAVESSEHMTAPEVRAMAERLATVLAGF
jgi:exosome complex component RRP40